MRSVPAVVVWACLSALTLVSCSRQPSGGNDQRSPAASEPISTAPRSSFGPTVAGRFYPSDPAELRSMLQRFLQTKPSTPAGAQRLFGLIVPHAGYVYSGAVAGRGWAWAAAEPGIRTVIVLGPSHHRSRDTASTIDRDVYHTPIGDVPIALDVVGKLTGDPARLVRIDSDVLAPEHSVDVQVPFIRAALPSAKLVPIVVPWMPPEQLEALGALLFRATPHDGSALIVASSDLSHFFDAATAESIDSQIEREIVAKSVDALLANHEQRRGPCGVAPIAVLIAYSKLLGREVTVTPLERTSSGNTPEGDKTRVVGYLAASFSTTP